MTRKPGRTKWSHLDDIDPAEWTYVGGFDAYPDEGQFGIGDAVAAIEDSAVTLFNSTGQCDHCGAHIRYVAVIRHEPTGDVIATGETCLGHRFDFMDRVSRDLAALKREAAAARDRARERAEAAEKRAEFTADHAFEAKVCADVLANPDGRDHFLVDLAQKFERHGFLTDGQIPWVSRCVEREAENVDLDAKRAAEAALAKPAPEGRVVVRGEILGTKTVDGYLDGDVVHKLLVLDDNHFKVWVTEPRSLVEHGEGGMTRQPDKGDRIEFTATLTPSADDACFAIAKRPSKARYVPTEEEK